MSMQEWPLLWTLVIVKREPHDPRTLLHVLSKDQPSPYKVYSYGQMKVKVGIDITTFRARVSII